MRNLRIIGGIAGKIALAFVLAFLITLVLLVPFMAFSGMAPAGANSMETIAEALEGEGFFIMSVLSQAAGFIGATVLMYYWFERKKGWSVGWRQQGAVQETVKGSIFGIVLMTIIFLTMWATGAIDITGMKTSPDVWKQLLLYLFVFAIVALNEELFSRGYVQGLIRHHYGKWASIAVSSLLFSLLHALNPGALEHPLPLINLVAAGFLLAVSREVTGGLWFPIGLHWTWNFMQGNVFGFEVSGNPVESLIRQEASGADLWSGGAFGAEGSLIATAVTVAATVWICRSRKARR